MNNTFDEQINILLESLHEVGFNPPMKIGMMDPLGANRFSHHFSGPDTWKEEDFRHADLSYSQFNNIALINVDLRGADLYCADICMVDFREVTFQEANLKYALFRSVTFNNVDFRDTNVTIEQVKAGKYEGCKVKVPAHIDLQSIKTP